MFELEKVFRFEAGHVLKYHKGQCSRPHGHSYELTLRLRADSLVEEGSSRGMVMDFADITAIVQPMIDQYLDHHWLNDTLQSDSTTCEFIARWIYNHLKPQIPLLAAVKLRETPTASVTYAP